MNTSSLPASTEVAQHLRAQARQLPIVTLDAAQLAALEVLLQGALTPLYGFTLDAAGQPFALPLSSPLDIGGQRIGVGDELCLQDVEGVSLALMRIDDLRREGDSALLAGTLRGIELPQRELFADARLSVDTLRRELDTESSRVPTDDAASSPGLCVHLRGRFGDSLGAGQLSQIRQRANGGRVLFRVLDTGDADRAHLLKRALHCARQARDACGAAPGVVAVCADAAAATMTPDHARALDECFARNVGCADNLWIDGAAPSARSVDADAGLCVFFTGLSGSGKSTLARALHARLVTERDRAVTLLDGDVVRRELSKGLGFSRTDRDLNVRRIGYVASQIVLHGGLVICAPIAPWASTRGAVRDSVEAHGHFFLVHVSTALEVCEARDRKGLYARARAGEIAQFTGISDPYETPTDADLHIDTHVTDIGAAIETIMQALPVAPR